MEQGRLAAGSQRRRSELHYALVGPVVGNGLWSFYVKVAIFVRFALGHLSVFSVVAFKLDRGTKKRGSSQKCIDSVIFARFAVYNALDGDKSAGEWVVRGVYWWVGGSWSGLGWVDRGRGFWWVDRGFRLVWGGFWWVDWG